MKGYEVPQLAKDLVDLSDLLLVLQVDGSVEVGDLVLLCGALHHDVVLTGMDEVSHRWGDTRQLVTTEFT